MNPAHFHILFNHLPIMGIPLIGVLLAWGVFAKQNAVQRVALAFLVMLALATIPVYLTGEPAEEIVEDLTGVSETVIERHEDIALWAFVMTELLGVLGLVGLVAARRRPTLRFGLTVGTVGATAVAVALLAWTGYLGAQIRHSEVRSDAPVIEEIEAEH